MAQINASIDNVSYDNINKIVAGGKNILLSAIESGGDLPSNVVEIKTGSYTPSSTVSSGLVTFTHGCTGTPHIIIMWSDYKTFFTAQNQATHTTLVGETYNDPCGTKTYSNVSSGYSGTSDATGTYGTFISDTTIDGLIVNVGESTFDIKTASNRRIFAGLTYQWIAIRLQGVG